MNGRIYDPKLGRMLQADPFIQSPTNSQSLNRYSYVLNNPLSYTDPSGYFSFSRFVKKWGRMIVASVATYFTAGLASGWTVGWGFAVGTVGNAAIAGAVAGFVGGGILAGTLKGAFYGGLTGAALGGIGASSLNSAAKTLASGAASGITTDLQGGKFGHGFLSAGMGFWSGLKFGGPPEFGKFLVSSIASGTISEVTGGKFANGAVSAGLAYVVAAAASSGGSRDITETRARDMTDAEFAAVFGDSSEWVAYESIGTHQQEIMIRNYHSGKISLEELNDFFAHQAGGAAAGAAISGSVAGGLGYASAQGFSVWARYYPNAKGIGFGLNRFDKNLIRFDWHRWGKPPNIKNRPHIDIPYKGIKHWPWKE